MTASKITRVEANLEARKLMADAAGAGRRMKLNQALHEVAKSHGYANLQHMKRHYVADVDFAQSVDNQPVQISPLVKGEDGLKSQPAESGKRPTIDNTALARLIERPNVSFRFSKPGESKSRVLLKPFGRKEPTRPLSVPTGAELKAVFACSGLDESPDYPKSEWMGAAAEGGTELGYWDWTVQAYATNGSQSPIEDHDRGVWEFDIEAGATEASYWEWRAWRHANPPPRQSIFGGDVVELKLASISPEDVRDFDIGFDAGQDVGEIGTHRRNALQKIEMRSLAERIRAIDEAGKEASDIPGPRMSTKLKMVRLAATTDRCAVLPVSGEKDRLINEWNLRDLATALWNGSAIRIDADDLPPDADGIAEKLAIATAPFGETGIVIATGFSAREAAGKFAILIDGVPSRRDMPRSWPVPAGWTLAFLIEDDVFSTMDRSIHKLLFVQV